MLTHIKYVTVTLDPRHMLTPLRLACWHWSPFSVLVLHMFGGLAPDRDMGGSLPLLVCVLVFWIYIRSLFIPFLVLFPFLFVLLQCVLVCGNGALS